MKFYSFLLAFNLSVGSFSFAQTTTGGSGVNSATSTAVMAAQEASSQQNASTMLAAQNQQAAAQKMQAGAQMGITVSAAVMAASAVPCFSGFGAHTACYLFFGGVAGLGVSIGLDVAASHNLADAKTTENQVTSGATAIPPNPILSSVSGTIPASNLAAINSALNPVGASMNSSGVLTTPNGVKIKASDLAAGNFSGTGLSAEGQQAAKAKASEIMNDASAQAAKAGSAVGTGAATAAAPSTGTDTLASGGGNGLGEGSASGSGFNFRSGTPGANGTAKRATASDLAGAKKLVAGGKDAVGLAFDNLFGMVGNRYNALGNSGSVLTAVPAAVGPSPAIKP